MCVASAVERLSKTMDRDGFTPSSTLFAMQVACDESKGDAFILFVSDIVNSGGPMCVQ